MSNENRNDKNDRVKNDMVDRNDVSPKSRNAKLRRFSKHATKGKTMVLTAKEMLSHMRNGKHLIGALTPANVSTETLDSHTLRKSGPVLC